MTLTTPSCVTGVGDVSVCTLLISYQEPSSIGGQLMFFSGPSEISAEPRWTETWDPPRERLEKASAHLLKDPLGDARKIARKFTDRLIYPSRYLTEYAYVSQDSG